MALVMAKLDALVRAARDARVEAYAPYSKFRVGAAALGGSGKIFTGCNVENASYGLTLCAERVAIAKAVSEGEKEITAIAVVAGEKIARPCGACLQVMQEFSPAERPMMVVAASTNGDYDVLSLDGYLPKPFRFE